MINIDSSFFIQFVFILLIIQFLRQFLFAPIISLIEKKKIYFFRVEEEIENIKCIRIKVAENIESNLATVQHDIMKSVQAFKAESKNMCNKILEKSQTEASEEVQLSKRLINQARSRIYGDLNQYKENIKRQVLERYLLLLKERGFVNNARD